MMKFLQLKVVVWKNLIIRKRHWILTIIESILPILLFLLIAYGRSKISGLSKVEITETTYNDPETISYDSFSVDSTYLFYTPNTEFYQDIIKRTQEKFGFYTNNIRGFDSNDDLLRYYASHHNNTVIAIIFNGNNKKALDYVIRYHDESYYGGLDTSKLYTNMFQFNPGTGTAYYWKGLLSIQKALDISFMEVTYGRDLERNFTINIQEFPYPPHNVDYVSSLFSDYLPLITIFSFIFLCPAVLKRVVEEKYTGIKELLKMVGMKSWMLWLGWFIYGMFPIIFSVTFIVMLMKVPIFGTDYPPIEYSDGTVLFVFLILYCIAAIVFCFAISSFFSRPTIAVVVGILIWILSYFVPKYAFGLDEPGSTLSWNLSMLINLLPNMALHYGYGAISLYEEREIGIQWSNFYRGGTGGADDITMLNVFTMLLIDILIYISFTFYMDGINPGKYGVRKSIIFPIYSIFKLMKKSVGKWDERDMESTRLDNIEVGHDLKKGIEIQNLYKRYGHKLAVNNLNFDIYQNQITVLLGQNGAGKSTTMSMITGMIDTTSGTIKMNGIDIKNNMNELRSSLGLCPQHNLLFADLTVGEHLQFFARLKGKTSREAEEEAGVILNKLNLSEKKNSMATTLSGGMKRKLCLGMAIIGGSNVLILDEPTSGMDPESRRELWDLLLSWRGEKTILITTHFMEEADALGDWIAIMANGSLQCYGSPMYLKKKYDTGYHLSLIVSGSATKEQLEKIKRAVWEYIPEAQFKDINGNNMTFVLPFEDNMIISDLLSYLEDHKGELKVENISVSVTTLEDVFLKAKLENEPKGNKVERMDSTRSKCSVQSQNRLLTMRVYALLKKKIQFYRKKVLTYLIPALIAAVFFFLAIYLGSAGGGNSRSNGPELKLQLGAYKQSMAYYAGNENDVGNKIKSYYSQLVEINNGIAVNVKNVEQAILDNGKENIAYYKEHLIVSAAFRIDTTIHATALYNAIALHSSPISLNLITNAIAKTVLGNEYSILARSWPLKSISSDTSPQEYSDVKIAVLWLIMIPIGCLFIIGSFIMYPNIELSTKFTQIQYMCGVKPYLYWIVNFMADLICYMIIMTILTSILLAAPYVGFEEFGTLLFIFFMYGVGAIPFAYLFGRKSSASAAFSTFIITGIFLGIILTVIIGFMMNSIQYADTGKQLKILFMLVFPQFSVTYLGVEFSRKAVENYNMEITSRTKLKIQCGTNPNPCCSGSTLECESYKSYWPLLQDSCGYMILSFVIYLAINILWDCFFVKKWLSQIAYKLHTLTKNTIKISNNGDHSHVANRYNTLNARNLQKTYSGVPIVKNIGFSIQDGECLGILGVNGAGKTTTFRMLTREEIVDEGVVEIKDGSGNIKINDDKYLENLGYCPQVDALNFVLTGRQILNLIAQLRGIDDPQIADLFLNIFELEKYADIPCGHYSGGNKRKLSLAVALIGYPKFVLLDEPTNGVDPSSRRKFWNLIKSIQKKEGLAFILTSHSMLECEALCNNLKIMKNGRFEKEGTISELKKEFGGYTVKIKLGKKHNLSPRKAIVNNEAELNDVEGYDEVDSPLIAEEEVPHFETIEEFKEYIINSYGGEIKDEHSGLLHFYIKDKNKKWSSIFKDVERMKMVNPHLIEDYAISEASLEDIFLSVARSGEKPLETKKKRLWKRGTM